LTKTCRRKKERESATCSPIWTRSPSPPKKKYSKNEEKHLDHKDNEDEPNKKSKKRKREGNSKDKQKSKKNSGESDGESDSTSEAKKRKHSQSNVSPLQEEIEDEEDRLTAERWGENKLLLIKPEEDEDIIGPVPLPEVPEPMNYGAQLLPGEGEAIANYVRDQKRIPRRGEVGLTSDQIDRFEKIGYVMSGSRNRRMNAVRIRKENQVLNVEEKRLLAQVNVEEKAKRENKILADFRDILVEKGLVQKPQYTVNTDFL